MRTAFATPRPWWLATAAWAALIFVLSAQPDLRVAPDPLLDFVLRKVGHFVVFGVLGVLIWAALKTGDHARAALAATLLASAYALTDEAHQAFVSGRTPFVGDVLIDACGALVFVVLVDRVMSSRLRPS